MRNEIEISEEIQRDIGKTVVEREEKKKNQMKSICEIETETDSLSDETFQKWMHSNAKRKQKSEIN